MESSNPVESAQHDVFEFLDEIPASTYIYAMLGSILASATLYALGRRHSAIFVGEWAPTFVIVGLFYKLLRPSGRNMGGRAREAFGTFAR